MSSPSEKPAMSSEEREAMIRRLAYRHYLRRGATAGQDLHDWLAAEAEVDALLGKTNRTAKHADDASPCGE